MNQRMERDSMGEMAVPADAYYGAQTARAVENFPISSLRFQRPFISALGMIKSAAAMVNSQMGLLDERRRELIHTAAEEVVDGKLDGQFVVDVFQTGSGTSTNMNANEVIASRANELESGKRGGRDPVHPNDHVNLQQSSNDVIPSAIHLAGSTQMNGLLVPALQRLSEALETQALRFEMQLKIGRTHLQDATPMTLGQELGGYAAQARYAVERVGRAIDALRELPLGGTAVGTGINSEPEFAGRVIDILCRRTGLKMLEAKNHFEAQAAKDGVVEASGLLRSVAISLTKIANDIRWLASGPRCGIGELRIPATQPGSSIMPGKVNPVMSEMVLQVAAQVVGNDATICWAGSGLGSSFELNVMMPVMAFNLLQSIELLSSAARVFADRCVAGIEADTERCSEMVERSLAMATSLAPIIGYDRAADIAKESLKTGRSIREIAIERNVLPPAELTRALDARRMTQRQGMTEEK